MDDAHGIRRKRSAQHHRRPEPSAAEMATVLAAAAAAMGPLSPSSSSREDYCCVVGEIEEYTAGCLMLLARGEDCLYECRTCRRRFSSFQALGGHRASHKRPRPPITAAVEAAPVAGEEDEERRGGGKREKVHECGICGSEFSSGQALGGHMRRHRGAVRGGGGGGGGRRTAVLQLDLNLPAPEEDCRLVFSAAPALVHCYY